MGCDKMYDVYTIKEGDTIESIANKYNITPYILYQLNGINNNVSLIPGNNIIVPKIANTYFDYYTIKKGDSLYKIAEKYNTDYKTLALINGLDENDYIYPNQIISVPKVGVKYYIVQEGDTLLDIGNKLNSNVIDLVNQNNQMYLLCCPAAIVGQLFLKKGR